MADIFDAPAPKKKKDVAHLKPYQFKQGEGRKKGEAAYATRARKICDKYGFDPLEEAILRYRDDETPNKSRDACLSLIMDRCYPKLKAQDTSAGDAAQVTKTFVNLIAGNQVIALDADMRPVTPSIISDAEALLGEVKDD